MECRLRRYQKGKKWPISCRLVGLGNVKRFDEYGEEYHYILGDVVDNDPNSEPDIEPGIPTSFSGSFFLGTNTKKEDS